MSSENTRKAPIDPSHQDDVRTGTFSEDPLDPNMTVNVQANNAFWSQTVDDTSINVPDRRSLAVTDPSIYSHSAMYPQQNDNRHHSHLYGSSSFYNPMNSFNANTNGMLPLEPTTQRGQQQADGYGEFLSASMPYQYPAGHNDRLPNVTIARPIDTSNLAAAQNYATFQLETVPNLDRTQQQLMHPLGASMQHDIQYAQNPIHNNWMNYSHMLPQLTGDISPLQQPYTQTQVFRPPMDHARVAMPNIPFSQFQSPVAAYPNYPSSPPYIGNLETVAANQYIEPISQIVPQSAAAQAQVSTNEASDLEDSKQPAVASESGLLSAPVRPLSAYNFFFRFERERLLKYTHFGDEEPKKLPSHYFDHYTLTVYNSTEFQRQLLEEQWSRDPNTKRKHCKSHGRISFRDLAKRIAKNWHDLPKTTQDVFREIAKQDHQRYLREMQTYKESTGNKK